MKTEGLFVLKTDTSVQRNRNSAFIGEKEVQSPVPHYYAHLAALSEEAAQQVR